MRRQIWCMFLVISLTVSLNAVANGWASGLYFVPATVDTTVTDNNGDTMEVSAGTPIHVTKTNGDLETFIRRNEVPWERQVDISRKALPAVLDGFWTYQRADFETSSEFLQEEAATESDPLVQTWKLILAGHSHMLADAGDADNAIRLYREATRTGDNPFRADAHYFAFRVLRYQGEYEEAREELDALSEATGDESFQASVLFSAYPHSEPAAAWGRAIPDLEELRRALDAVIGANRAVEEARGAAAEDVAQSLYQLAAAKEDLWGLAPDRFYDDTRPPEVARLLRRIFENYPETSTASKAYYHHLEYRRYWDFDGPRIMWERQQKEFMEDFLSKYPESSLVGEARKRLEAAKEAIAELEDES